MEQESSNQLEGSVVKSEVFKNVHTHISPPPIPVEAIEEDGVELAPSSKFEILEEQVSEKRAKTDEDGVPLGCADTWLGKQKVDQVTASSSEEEISSTPEKTVQRKKKRTKPKSQAVLDREKKVLNVEDVLSSTPLDLEALRELAIGEGGLVRGKTLLGIFINMSIQ
nr:uncharacterized protein LOC128694713 [Cherax quadricarinatus]XP_053640950.1 uncharacterized protein LOC128694713 [Cherax quadricarinatus]